MYIIVAGGGMVGGGLARRLLENKHDVVLVDQDKEVCDRMYAETGVVAINGVATRIDILKEAGADKADALVAATGDDAGNLACAVLAKSLDIPQVIVRMRDPNYENAYRVAGVDAVVRVTDMMINQMLIEIENPEVRRLFTIGGGKANIFMVVVPKEASVAGQKVSEIAQHPEFPAQSIFVAVYRPTSKDFFIPRGDQVIDESDELFLIAPAEYIKEAVDVLTAKKQPEAS